MELVAVMVGAKEDPAVRRRDPDAANRLLREGRQLVRPAAFHRDAPEVELPGHVAGEQQLRPVGREGQRRRKTADREELLHEGQPACLRG